MNEIIKSLYQRKSVRVFTKDEISKESKAVILNAALQAPSAGCQLLYTILDITDREKKELLELPSYVYPACMLVFGYPVKQQIERKKPQRFDLSYMVCENRYQSKSSGEIRSMFSGMTGEKDYDTWMKNFWERKYESDFSREMNRSMEVYLKDFKA